MKVVTIAISALFINISIINYVTYRHVADKNRKKEGVRSFIATSRVIWKLLMQNNKVCKQMG